MNAKKTLIIAFVGAYCLFLSCSGAWAWQRNVNGSAANGFDSAHAVAVDAAGNVVAAGITNGICVDIDCYVYVSNFTVVKFDGASGAELWRRVINGTANSNDWANAVAVDAAGNVVAVGLTANNGTFGDFTVIKFDGASGAELWRQVINGTASTANGGVAANAVAVDAAGNVVAAGFTLNTDTDVDFTVIKFDGVSGTELWRQLINGTANGYDSANAVAVDAAGNVVAAGFTDNIGTYDFTVVKFDGVIGAELWRGEINGTATNSYDWAYAVAVDAAGNVVAAGFTENAGTFADFTVIKFDGASGAELWRQLINGTANGYDFARAVAVDAEGNVVAAGTTYNAGTSSDFTVVKFDGVSGAELWRKEINGTDGTSDGASAVAVDGVGNVVAAGSTLSSGSGWDLTVVKLSGQFSLRVLRAGTGTGTVSSNPAGINCGGDCSEAYDGDTVVTLTATPDASSVFSGWSGDPDCSDGIVTMNADKSCTATFWKRLHVTAANGGELWHRGSRQTIQWTSIGISGPVRIELSRDGGASWKTLFRNVANDGSQPWRVNKPATTQARIRICSLSSPSICDTSDADFAIQ